MCSVILLMPIFLSWANYLVAHTCLEHWNTNGAQYVRECHRLRGAALEEFEELEHIHRWESAGREDSFELNKCQWLRSIGT